MKFPSVSDLIRAANDVDAAARAMRAIGDHSGHDAMHKEAKHLRARAEFVRAMRRVQASDIQHSGVQR